MGAWNGTWKNTPSTGSGGGGGPVTFNDIQTGTASGKEFKIGAGTSLITIDSGIIQATDQKNKTGTGTTFVTNTSPTFTGTVTLPAAQVVNGVTLSTAAGTGNFLRGDGAYAAAGGTGDFKADGTVAMTGTITSTLGSVATSTPTRSDTATWTGGGTYIHETSNVTDTSSAAGSLLREWKVGGTQIAALRKDGSLQWGSASNRVLYSAGSGGIVFDVSGQTRLVIQTGGLDLGGSNDTFIKRISASLVGVYANNASSTFGDIKVRTYLADATITTAGTTGNQTINKSLGTVNFAAAATTLVVTNSIVTTSSIIFCTIRTNDTTAIIKNVVPAAGSFTINLNAAATAETSVGFIVYNG